MLSSAQLRRAKIEDIVHRLSFKHSQEKLAGVAPLLKDPFFLELFSSKSFEFKRVTGMSRYTAEDALSEVFDAEFAVEDGALKFYVGRKLVLDTPEDILGTVSATMASRAREHYEICRGLDSDLASGSTGCLDTIAIHRVFDEPNFTKYAAPFYEYNHPTEFHNYLEALGNLEGVPPPGECSPIQRPLWGKYYTRLAQLYLILRKANRLPPIERPFDPDTPVCNLLQLASDNSKNGHPSDGLKFQEWELKMIETMQPGGPDAKILEHEGREYLVPMRLLDPFEYIGSSFYRLPPLPELVPCTQASYAPPPPEGHGISDSDGDEFEDACGSAAPPTPVAPTRVETRKTVTFAVPPPVAAPKDQYAQVRRVFRDYLAKPPNLSDKRNFELREDCKIGGPTEEGKDLHGVLSKRKRDKFCKSMPRGEHPLPEFIRLIKEGPENAAFGECEDIPLAYYVLSKCILGCSQLPVAFRGGEVYITNCT